MTRGRVESGESIIPGLASTLIVLVCASAAAQPAAPAPPSEASPASAAALPAAPPPETSATAPAVADAVPEPTGYWTGPINSAVPATLTGGKVIHPNELPQLIEKQHPVVIDVSNAPKRPKELAPEAPWMPLEHQSIPGSLWIPGVGLGEISSKTDELFRQRLAAATGHNLSRPIVIYCHEHCWLSWNAAKRAISYGYRNVYWLPDGVEGWRAAGQRTVVVQPMLQADERRPPNASP